jgi:hypothetical protein
MTHAIWVSTWAAIGLHYAITALPQDQAMLVVAAVVAGVAFRLSNIEHVIDDANEAAEAAYLASKIEELAEGLS